VHKEGTALEVAVVVVVVGRVEEVCSAGWGLHHVELAVWRLSDLEEGLNALLRLSFLHFAA